MSIISKPNTFTAGQTIIASQHNSNFDTIYADYNGSISNVNLAADAAIVGSKLASLASITSGAGIIPANNLPAVGLVNMATGVTSGPLATVYGGSGTTANANAANGVVVLDGNGKLPAGVGGVPSGLICMWSGTIANIPSGWYLCNGSNGTPDLRDRFVIGATSDDGGVAKTNVTGSLTVSGDGSIPAHTHSIPMHSGGGGSGCYGASVEEEPINTGSYGTGTKNIAVYYALAFIMKS